MRFTDLVLARGVSRKIRPGIARIKGQPNPKQDLVVEKISSGEKEISSKITHKLENVHHGNNISTFESLNLRTDVIQGLENLKVSQPTTIQMLSIPLIMEKKNIFCAAQTGSGKTLVYVAPIINSIKEGNDNGYLGRLSRPRALVVAPARELAEQILKIFKSFTYSAPVRSLGLIGQRQKKWRRDYLKGVVDVVVGTPSTLVKYHKKSLLSLADLQYLVLDEADTLMDENFSSITEELLNSCHFDERGISSMKLPVQCILASATLPPKGVLSSYKRHIPNLEVCQSNLHKVLPNVKHTFIKTTQEEKYNHAQSKILSLLRNKDNNNKCVVFCNTSKSCNWLSHKFNENEIVHSKLHGKMDPQLKKKCDVPHEKGTPQDVNIKNQIRFRDFEKFMYEDNKVLVCTDIASRGLDTSDVTLVMNFDCPFNTTDYLHRSGRTGRAQQLYDGKAEVVTYITQNKEVLFARKIQSAAEKNESLEDIKQKTNSPKERYRKQLAEYEQLRKKNKAIRKPVR